MRGRKATATALKVLNGNPGKQKLNHREPQPRLITPDRPEDLKGRAAEEWDRLVHEMGSAPGWLTEAERATLYVAARSYSRWLALEDECDQFGNVFESLTHMDEHGVVVQADDPRARFARMSRKPNPALVGINRERQAYFRAIVELGLSPTQRSRLVIKQADDEDDDLDSG